MSERRKTILVVDDDEGMRETLTAVLKGDYRVLRAATGEAALQMMEKEDIELMLLDVFLPGISGFEVLKITKENYPYVEVIVISVVKELDAAIEAMRYGGCSVAAHTELGDMYEPSCHKGAFESAVVGLAERTAAAIA